MQPALQIYLFGSFRITAEGKAVANSSWQKRKAKLLMQILALRSDHELHREELMEILFPETDEKTASTNLYRVLYAARRALESHFSSPSSRSNYLITDGKQIKLNTAKGLWIDAEEFEQKARIGLKTNNCATLESAIELYKGDLLTDEPFEEWISISRERFKMLAHKILRRLAEMAEKQNAIEDSHYWLDKILQLEPADEIAHRAKIRLFAAHGDNVLALRQYEKCREVLWRELAVEPDGETKRLKQKITASSRK